MCFFFATNTNILILRVYQLATDYSTQIYYTDLVVFGNNKLITKQTRKFHLHLHKAAILIVRNI